MFFTAFFHFMLLYERWEIDVDTTITREVQSHHDYTRRNLHAACGGRHQGSISTHPAGPVDQPTRRTLHS